MTKFGMSVTAVVIVLAIAGAGHAQHGHGGGGHGGGFHGGGWGGHGGGFHGGGWGGYAHLDIGPWWWGYPDYRYYRYWNPPYYVPPPYYGYPPAVDLEEPSEYAQKAPERSPRYWYYCPPAKAYYPTVRDCPEDWVRVLPRESGD